MYDLMGLATFKKAKVFNSIQVVEVLCFLSMTTSVKFLLQMVKSKSTYNRLPE